MQINKTNQTSSMFMKEFTCTKTLIQSNTGQQKSFCDNDIVMNKTEQSQLLANNHKTYRQQLFDVAV